MTDEAVTAAGVEVIISTDGCSSCDRWPRIATMRAAVLVAVVAVVAHLVRAVGSGEEEGANYADADVEGDSAPFTIVVEHGYGWRCLGSLVSLRTALTSAGCARGRGARRGRDLWVRPTPASRNARRVARIAFLASSEAVVSGDGVPDATVAGDPWRAAAEDLALLELEAPFGIEAHARPILMAMRAEDCAPPKSCHAVRSARGTLRIVDMALVAGEECAARAPRWPSLRSSALCLVGPTLCAGDWGAGVVCEGKLCGVVSRSAGAGVEGDGSCGDTHVAQAVPRWRRFLRCAHTLGACGSEGECAQHCIEEQLTGEAATEAEAEAEPEAAAGLAARAPSVDIAFSTGGGGGGGGGGTGSDRVSSPHRTSLFFRHTTSASKETRATMTQRSPPTRPGRKLSTSAAPTGPTPTPAPAPAPASAAQLARPSNEFEPNRPDFKAGEYGDNVAEYGGEDLPVSSGGTGRGGRDSFESGSGAPTRTTPAPSLAPAAWRQLSVSPETLPRASRSGSNLFSSLRCPPLPFIFMLRFIHQ